MPKLTVAQKHILQLINKHRDENGWTKVSDHLIKTIKDTSPSELVRFTEVNNKHFAQLTSLGQEIVNAMEWL